MSVNLTQEQFQQLLASVGSSRKGSMTSCTATYNGRKDRETVEAFLTAVQVFKKLENISEGDALSALPLVLRDDAAVWWQGIKNTIATWESFEDALRNTFAPKKPVYEIYLEACGIKQAPGVSTDDFVTKKRMLFSELPRDEQLNPKQQLHITYGLLSLKIREKVPIEKLKDFDDLLKQARSAEALLKEKAGGEEREDRREKSAAIPTSGLGTQARTKKASRCNFCKKLGHVLEECRKRKRTMEGEKEQTDPTPSSSSDVKFSCYGCGTPGVYRTAEYDLLPRLTAVAAYAPCMRAPGDVYCLVSADLHGNRSDPLYNTLVEYSENVLTHFNHTKLHRGICPKKSCAQHMKGSSNLTLVLEACLNETLSRQYRLTARVSKALCEEYQEQAAWDAGDYAYGAVVLTLLALNLLGSLYDFFYAHGKDTAAGRWLLCFAVRRSWRRLVAPSSPHPMHRRVKVIHSMRTITAFGVVLGHSPIPALFSANDPQFLEETYHSVPFLIIYNGSVIVQTFFLISGFLLAYNIMLSEEKRPATWKMLPKAVILRWLRLTPPYAMVMFYVMTWARHLSHGPFSLVTVTSESWDCHRNWWRHLLYIHNYQDGAPCMVHAWYLGAEFQLSVVGLLIFCLVRGVRGRRLAIGAVLLLGLLLPAAHTALQDLHPILIPSPEVIMNFFAFDPTFNNLYKRGHTNLLCYGLGLAVGFPVYHLKESDLGADRFKKYRLLYWLLFPLMVLATLACAVFYADGLAAPLAVRAVYASAFKLVLGLLVVLFMFFTIVKVDSACRGVLHWGGWARASRLTYVAYLVHVPLLRYSAGNNSELVPISTYWIAQNYASCLLLSFTLAVPLFLLVELPLAELVKVALLPARAPALPEKAPPGEEDGGASKETVEMQL